MANTATKVAPKKIESNIDLVAKCVNYLRDQFTVKKGEFLKISHLWGNNFRVTLYQQVKHGDDVLPYDKIVRSDFVRVDDSKDGMSHEIIGENNAS